MLLFYGLFSTGLLVNAHYCGEQLVDISFIKESKSCCETSCGLAADCCNETSVYFENDIDELPNFPIEWELSDVASEAEVLDLDLFVKSLDNQVCICLYAKPPPKERLFLVHQSLKLLDC